MSNATSFSVSVHKRILPKEITDIIDLVLSSIKSTDYLRSLGFFCLSPEQENNDFAGYQLVFYPSAYEIVGGAEDGKIVNPGFYLQFKELLNYFNEINHFVWRNPSQYLKDLDGPEILIDGKIKDYNVRLRILSYQPVGEELLYILDSDSNRFFFRSSFLSSSIASRIKKDR